MRVDHLLTRRERRVFSGLDIDPIERALGPPCQDVQSRRYGWRPWKGKGHLRFHLVAAGSKCLNDIVSHRVVEVPRVGDILGNSIAVDVSKQRVKGISLAARIGPTPVIVAGLLGVEARLRRGDGEVSEGLLEA